MFKDIYSYRNEILLLENKNNYKREVGIKGRHFSKESSVSNYYLRQTQIKTNNFAIEHSLYMNDHADFLTYGNNSYTESCLDDGCEAVDEDVAMATYVLELVLMPIVGAVGVLGNLLSIIVLCKSDQKETTFQHVHKYDFIFSPDCFLTGDKYNRNEI